MIKTQKQNLNHLIDAFRDGNETEFIFLLDTYAFNSNVSLNSVGIDSSLIEYILSTPKSSNFIKICLKYGDNYHKRNSNGLSLLVFAVKSLCADNLKIGVDHLNRLGLENVVQQMTLNSEIPNNNNLLHNVLHSLSIENKEECKKIIEILLKNGCNPNHFNAEHITPFELLLNKIQNDKLGSDLIEIFLNNSIQCIEISDSEFNRNLVTDINSEKLIIRNRSIADIANLIDLINQGNENEFIESLQKTEISIQVPNNFTNLMKRCIEMNFVNGAKELMQCSFNVSESNMNNGCDRHSFISKVTASKIDEKPLLFYAVKLNRPKIIKLLLNLNCAQFKSDQHNYSVLHEICSMQEVDCDEDFQKCFNLLIKNHRCDISLINGFDGNRKTPLMYACENDHKEIIYELIRRGAYIGHECIIEKLSEDVLRKVLNDSIVPTRDINDQNCAVKINYKFLIPPKYSEKRNDETKALKLIASQSKFKNLMTHPVLTSYLELKWKRVNILVYMALFLYFIFFVYLSVFILNFFSDARYAGNMSKVNNENDIGTRDHIPRETTTTTMNPLIEELKNVNVWKAIFGRKKREAVEVIAENEPHYNAELAIDPKSIDSYIASNKINYSICLIGTLILTFCEIVQFIFSWKRYFLKLSNWVDCVLLYLAYVVLLNYYADDVELFRKFRAVLFLVISVQSFILLSRVSKLSLQLEIFKKVSKTFLKFIMLYFMLLFAFAMAFYTLYGRDKMEDKSSDENKNDNKKPENDDENGFQNILISVVTVIRMMLSDFDKMKLDPQDMFNSIIFLTFVILITIILFNLLNALAINDTQQIMKSAEIVDVQKRIAMVENCEHILAFLKVEDFNVFTKLIHNGRIILKVNEDNYVRVEKVDEQIFESKENGYKHINMGQLNDIYNKPYEKYVKVETKWSKNFHELHKKFGNLRFLDPNLTLGKDNISKIVKHVKDLMEEEK